MITILSFVQEAAARTRISLKLGGASDGYYWWVWNSTSQSVCDVENMVVSLRDRGMGGREE